MNGASVTPQKQDVEQALRGLIQGIVGGTPPIEIVLGLGNRVPMPKNGFIAMTAIGSYRLETNQDTDIDGFYAVPPAPGITQALQATRLDLQIDFYGKYSNSWATMFGTLFRDDYSCEILGSVCQPLYADDPRMIPLISGEDQYLERWSVDCAIQYNPVTTTAQSFSASINIVPINVYVADHP